MRRPFCVFCVTLLIAQVASVYLPQNLFWILTAIFAFALLLLFAIKRHGYCICILLGIILGGTLFFYNANRHFAQIQPYLEQTVTLTARVESPYDSYIEDMVSATLQVDSVNGKSASFACHTVLLPKSNEGDLIQAEFHLTDLSGENDRLSSYGNCVFSLADYKGGFQSIGHVGGVRGFFIDAQTMLSEIIRFPFSKQVGGVLAAMTVGDRDHIPPTIIDHYRKAGLSHLLVVSGLHLSLICGIMLAKRSDSYRVKIRKSLFALILAFSLAAITGGTASILRAVFVLCFCMIANILYQYADPFTSLALAGVLLVFPNGYLVCNLSFQLSFLSTFGVLLGATFAARTLKHFDKLGVAYYWYTTSYTSILITAFASFATFPILMLWEMNVSLLSLVSNILTFWMIPIILIAGFLGALLGLIPFCSILSSIFLTMAGVFVAVLNMIVAKIALLPGGQLYFETSYALVVCLAVVTLAAMAYFLRLPYRLIIPGIATIVICAIVLGNYFMKDVIKVSLVGTRSMPAIVIAKNEEAIVLFRGGEYNIQAVETYLDKRGIDRISLVVDLRRSPNETCELESAKQIHLFDSAPFEESYFDFDDIQGTMFQTKDSGVVLLNIGGTLLATTSGKVELVEPYIVDVLLGTASDSGDIVGEIVLCRNNTYDYLDHYDTKDIFYGIDEASLWARYGGAYKLLGVTNDKSNR